MKIQQADKIWRNWSGSQFSTARIVQPIQISELQSLVKTHAHIRAVGAGHSCAAASGVRDEGMAPRYRLAGAGSKPP